MRGVITKVQPAESGFSFAVYGDSRSMMYLPYNADQEAEARKLMVDMFTLGWRYYAEKPADGPDWGLRFVVTLLFPQ